MGRALSTACLAKDFEVIILSRSGEPIEGATVAKWDGESIGEWSKLLSGSTAVINLAGEPVTLRWTDENKRRILDSRVKSTEVIGRAIRACSPPPTVWINASAVGYYGDTGDVEKDESSPAGEGFLPETCLAWERAHEQSETPGVRKVRIRIGLVLGRDGGAFEQLAKFTRRFLGGSQGSGRQWMPWIHIDDMAQVFLWALESKSAGVVNGVGPAPVRNSEFMATMRQVARRPWSPPAPSFALGLVGSIMGVQTDVVLQSQRVKSKVLQDADFEYRFPDLHSAIKDLFVPTIKQSS